MSDCSPNLVLGTAFGYDVKEVWSFVESLRRHYDGEVILLVSSRSSPGFIDYLRGRNIQLVYFDCLYWMDTHFQVARYIRYGELLRGSRERYDRVLLTDVGDVFFQAHPFADLPPGDLFFFLEDHHATITVCPSNSMWVQHVYGPEALLRLQSKRISCSGTTIGTHEAILGYIDKLLSHAKPALMSRLGRFSGHDQGIHNFLLHTGAFPGATVFENGGHVYTLAQVPGQDIAVDARGISLAGSARLPAVIHQYNYHAATKTFVEAAFPLPPQPV